MKPSAGFPKIVTGPSDAYAAWAPVYPPYSHNALMEVEEAAMMELLPPVSGRDVLDAGCGSGRYTRLLAQLGARVIGVDLSPSMAARAQALGLPVAMADMAVLPLASACCDVVVSGLAIPDVPDLQRLLIEWSRVLKHGGVLVYSTLHPMGRALGWKRTYESIDGMRSLPAHWYTLRDHLEACESAGFDIEHIAEPRLTAGAHPVALVIRARCHGE